MGQQYILAYDLGTTGNKAVLVDERCNLVATAFSPYQTFFPFATAVEQDPWDWWNSVVNATRQLLEKSHVNPREVQAISFSGQMMGCVPVSREADPIGRGIIWADMRGSLEASQLAARMGSALLYQILGNRVNASYSAAKILWIREHEPDRFRQAHKFLQPKDFIVARMTGNFVTDFSDACGTNLFDITRLQWSDAILEAAALDRHLLPEAYASTDVVGRLSDAVAAVLGLTGGTPVVIGGGDGACAAAGAGVINASDTYQYLGSSSWVGTASPVPLLDPTARIFNWAHVVPGLYAPTGTMQAGGGSFQWLKSTLGIETENGRSAYELMDEEADAGPAGANGLIFLPYLMGERSPVWNEKARGAFIGLTMQHSRSELIRAVMEGVAMNMKGILDAFTDQIKVDEIRFIGGGAKSRVWAQIFANIYGHRLRVPTVLDEATALGAAVTGGVGVGLFADFDVVRRAIETDFVVTPDMDRHRAYRRLQVTYEEAYRALIGTFDQLSTWAQG
ncbi:MAG: xylulokinase [Thermaerobacter sp.]|nr:xylulokinase [Thermaerobacter sp.]